MKNAFTAHRFVAYIIDIFIIGFITTLLTIGIPKSVKYEEANKKIDSLYGNIVSRSVNTDDAIKELYDNKYIVEKESIPDNLIAVVVSLGYFVAFAYFNKGQTIGKKLVKIRIVSSDSNEASYLQLFERALIHNGCLFTIINVISMFFIKQNQYFGTIGIMEYVQSVIMLISIIMISCRKDKRGIHDLLFKTMVVEC